MSRRKTYQALCQEENDTLETAGLVGSFQREFISRVGHDHIRRLNISKQWHCVTWCVFEGSLGPDFALRSVFTSYVRNFQVEWVGQLIPDFLFSLGLFVNISDLVSPREITLLTNSEDGDTHHIWLGEADK